MAQSPPRGKASGAESVAFGQPSDEEVAFASDAMLVLGSVADTPRIGAVLFLRRSERASSCVRLAVCACTQPGSWVHWCPVVPGIGVPLKETNLHPKRSRLPNSQVSEQVAG